MHRSVIWTKLSTDQLNDVVRNSKTFREILDVFGLNNIGGNSRTLKNRLNEEGIDYSHIPQGKYASRGRCNYQNKATVAADALVRDSKHSRKTAKRIILREELLLYKCAICGMDPKWNRKPLTLRLDHINGIRNDHRLENLRFLCPNCDSQTDTYGGRNFKRDRIKYSCSLCGGVRSKSSKSGLCAACSNLKRTKINNNIPSVEELSVMVWEIPTTQIALHYGVSDKAVAKWCKKYEIDKPGPGYWAKIRVG